MTFNQSYQVMWLSTNHLSPVPSSYVIYRSLPLPPPSCISYKHLCLSHISPSIPPYLSSSLPFHPSLPHLLSSHELTSAHSSCGWTQVSWVWWLGQLAPWVLGPYQWGLAAEPSSSFHRSGLRGGGSVRREDVQRVMRSVQVIHVWYWKWSMLELVGSGLLD